MVYEEIEIRAKVIAVQDGEKKLHKNFTSAYRSIRLKAGRKYYRVFLSPTQMDKYGVMPTQGMWFRVKGSIIPPKKELYDPVIKKIVVFEHIDPPIIQQIIEKYNRNNR